MPKFKQLIPRHEDGSIDLEAWLDHVTQARGGNDSAHIRQAVMLAHHVGAGQATPYGVSCLQDGLEIADVLLPLKMDDEVLCAAILYSAVQYADLGLDDVGEQVSDTVAMIIKGTSSMDAIQISHGRLTQSAQLSSSIDNLRKMLLAMVEDIRVVLLKLAQRVVALRHVGLLGENERRKIAQETIDIFAPLANRLGIAQLKWLLEDYAFRYLNPDQYKSISKSLKQRRTDREYYVEKMVSEIQDCVERLNVEQFEVYGRAKHIYSIFKKMQRKKLPIEEIFDVIAIRVLVPSIEDCYAVLGEVQNQWQPIAKEFDDYIANPKPNGYQSIHTAVIGPDERVFEVQIRTYDMHAVAELGVAAHWMYKEGRQQKSSYEAKIDWLRNVMEWQQEISDTDNKESQAMSHIFQDRVYVFTPRGDVLDLPNGATSLDFAYHIHSEVGNRCRGAKINDKLVPLTYVLQMGDQVEVITDKNGHPSRDWLNPHQKYLATSKAKAKVLHYFRQLDFERHVEEGEELFAKEAKRLHMSMKMHPKLLAKLNLKTKQDLMAAIGRGDIGAVTVLNALQNLHNKDQGITAEETSQEVTSTVHKPAAPSKTPSHVRIAGVDNLLTKMAGCCQPVPGDAVVGYVTLGSGVSIHRADCRNITNDPSLDPDRFVKVSWGTDVNEQYTVALLVKAHDRGDLIKDISSTLSDAKVDVLGLNSAINKAKQLATVSISLEVTGLQSLSDIIGKISRLPGVMEVKRQS